MKSFLKSLIVITIATFVVVLVVYAATTIGTNITSDGQLIIGELAHPEYVPNAKARILQTDTDFTGGEVDSTYIGLIAEAASDGTDEAVGVGGIARTGGSADVSGISGSALINNTADSGAARGVTGYSFYPHAGGMNIGVASMASGGAQNYSFYSMAGSGYFLLGAEEGLFLDAQSTPHVGEDGVIGFDLATGESNNRGVYGNVSLSADVSDVAVYDAKLSGPSGGGSSGDAISAFVTEMEGNASDTDYNYLAFNAGNFDSKGGTNTSRGLYVGSGYTYAIYATSGKAILVGIMGDLSATCTIGQLAIDTGGATVEICYCQTTNTWKCAAMAAGPTD